MREDGVRGFSYHLSPITYHFPSVSADLREQFGRGALEEGSVESADGLLDVPLLDDEGQVDGGRALRDEQDVDILYRREDAARDAGRRAQSLADDADNCALLLELDRAYPFEVGDYFGERVRLFERERDRNLRRCDDVHGRAVSLEDLEDCAQEAVRAEHARRSDVND